MKTILQKGSTYNKGSTCNVDDIREPLSLMIKPDNITVKEMQEYISNCNNSINSNQAVLSCNDKLSQLSSPNGQFIKDYTILHKIEGMDIISISIYNYIHNAISCKRAQLVWLYKNQKDFQNAIKYAYMPLNKFNWFKITTEELGEYLMGISRPKIANSLNKLEEMGFIESDGETRAKKYRIIKDLDGIDYRDFVMMFKYISNQIKISSTPEDKNKWMEVMNQMKMLTCYVKKNLQKWCSGLISNIEEFDENDFVYDGDKDEIVNEIVNGDIVINELEDSEDTGLDSESVNTGLDPESVQFNGDEFW